MRIMLKSIKYKRFSFYFNHCHKNVKWKNLIHNRILIKTKYNYIWLIFRSIALILVQSAALMESHINQNVYRYHIKFLLTTIHPVITPHPVLISNATNIHDVPLIIKLKLRLPAAHFVAQWQEFNSINNSKITMQTIYWRLNSWGNQFGKWFK